MEANRFIKWNQYWFHPVIISSDVFYVIVYLKFFYLSNQNIYLNQYVYNLIKCFFHISDI